MRLQARITRRFEKFLRGEDLGATEVRIALREAQPYQQIVNGAIAEGVDLIVVGE